MSPLAHSLFLLLLPLLSLATARSGGYAQSCIGMTLSPKTGGTYYLQGGCGDGKGSDNIVSIDLNRCIGVDLFSNLIYRVK